MPVNYLRVGAQVKVTDPSSEHYGKIARMVDDGGLADSGSNRMQHLKMDTGEFFSLRGYQLDFVIPDLNDIQAGYKLTDEEFRALIDKWLEGHPQ